MLSKDSKPPPDFAKGFPSPPKAPNPPLKPAFGEMLESIGKKNS